MPSNRYQRTEALKRAALLGLLKAVGAVPAVGNLRAGVGSFYAKWQQATNDLPARSRRTLGAMASDLNAFLTRQSTAKPEQTMAVALSESLAILPEHRLSAEELLSGVGLKPTRGVGPGGRSGGSTIVADPLVDVSVCPQVKSRPRFCSRLPSFGGEGSL